MDNTRDPRWGETWQTTPRVTQRRRVYNSSALLNNTTRHSNKFEPWTFCIKDECASYVNAEGVSITRMSLLLMWGVHYQHKHGCVNKASDSGNVLRHSSVLESVKLSVIWKAQPLINFLLLLLLLGCTIVLVSMQKSSHCLLKAQDGGIIRHLMSCCKYLQVVQCVW